MIIWSGGQTGVDRAAWDAAQEMGWEQGGWVPKGRLAEDGEIPLTYTCWETEIRDYALRTERNLTEADATLILGFGQAKGGTRLTLELCQRQRRPHLFVDLDGGEEEAALTQTREFLERRQPEILNVAGPRGSFRHDVYERARDFLLHLFRRTGGENSS